MFSWLNVSRARQGWEQPVVWTLICICLWCLLVGSKGCGYGKGSWQWAVTRFGLFLPVVWWCGSFQISFLWFSFSELILRRLMLPLIALPQVDVFIFGVWSYLSAFILILLTLRTYVWVYDCECGLGYGGQSTSYGSFLLIVNPGNLSGHRVCIAIVLAHLSPLESNLLSVDLWGKKL